MKNLPVLMALIVSVNFCYAQDYRAQFVESLQADDTLKQWEILTTWQKADPKSPELYTSYFNYYFQKSKQELIALTEEEPSGESMSFQDSTGQTVGFFGNQTTFNGPVLQKGLDKIDEGIRLYPNRLDMRFGKIYVLGQLEDWDNFTQEIVKAIQYSKQNKNAWYWTNNEKKENGQEFFLTSLQDYQVQLYEAGRDVLAKYMGTIANEVLKYYPDHVESMSNLSITYLLTDKPDKAIEILLKAEKISPRDPIILGNIAHGYKQAGDRKKAIEYYRKTIQYADPETAEQAEQQLKELER
ncbi:tetratricopeptide repeat protein [Dawidia soli]|uniref:Tetratricopeptide repeat protein n=1 Tax=Dawidia soli TaxID=2782352 RepID=A0AAP2D986_9BACT|nr:tetratricopeptide repeat protein [Dawidia soli]MBT1686665.1 tetratricopeptide repeat protein [Dawidia soli]